MLKIIPIAVSLSVVACTPADTKQIQKVVYDEQALKRFVLSTHDPNNHLAATALDSILQNADRDSAVFLQTITFLEVPLGSPNSAFRSDTLYATLLRRKAQSKWIDTVFKRKAIERIDLLIQNQPGTIANDFSYQTPEGYQKKLHDLESKFTLLFFYNPECPACKAMKATLASSDVISQKIKSKELTVLAIYTDIDESIWLKHLGEMPRDWMHGRDPDEYLYNNNVYDLRAIPTLYLLAADKKVLLKDCLDVDVIEEQLAQ